MLGRKQMRIRVGIAALAPLSSARGQAIFRTLLRSRWILKSHVSPPLMLTRGKDCGNRKRRIEAGIYPAARKGFIQRETRRRPQRSFLLLRSILY
ncbi:hypothetical protein GGR52DRAFT_485630 [Hypoxylon sp. FL1284]|nr:hypothetical protein GGR52DRAFT_485630 [Hypoxylon sp. FL1284]